MLFYIEFLKNKQTICLRDFDEASVNNVLVSDQDFTILAGSDYYSLCLYVNFDEWILSAITMVVQFSFIFCIVLQGHLDLKSILLL